MLALARFLQAVEEWRSRRRAAPASSRREVRAGDASAPRPRPSALRTAWALTRPFFLSRGAWTAWLLVGAIVLISVAETAMSVQLSEWQKRFYNAAQELDRARFYHEVRVFVLILLPLVAAYAAQAFVTQTLKMRWRAWLTRQCLDLWLRDQAYYRLQWSERATDNPDQRISEDAAEFVERTLGLVLTFFQSGLGLCTFAVILWRLSGTLSLRLPGVGVVSVPGDLLWGAVAYALLGTLAILRAGGALVRLEFTQEKREADFRYALVRLRENAESVALYGGEAVERRTLHGRFEALLGNTWALIKTRLGLSLATMTYGTAATPVPWLIAGTRFFAGAVTFGGLMQAASAFASVRNELSVVVNSYGSIASWRATVERLAGFAASVREVQPTAAATPAPASRPAVSLRSMSGGTPCTPLEARSDVIERAADGGAGLHVVSVATRTVDNRPIGAATSLDVAPGERVLIGGPSGAGKTTLLRAIAGIWPFGSGRIALPAKSRLVLSQRPYLPLGSLRDAICFPRPAAEIPDEEVARAMTKVGLGRLAPALDRASDWSHTLSLGEQQRIAFARALLLRPGLLVLDEATSALDPAAEDTMYRLVAEELEGSIVLSVGHRESLSAHHHRRVEVAGAGG